MNIEHVRQRCEGQALEVKEAAYLDQVDEGSEYGTSEHVVFFRLLPKQRQVLNQTAYVWPDLTQTKCY